MGSALADGTGVPVMHVEACSASPCAYVPDRTDAQFTGKTITDGDGGPLVSEPWSGHATSVGKTFYGNVRSMSPGITDVSAYQSDSWLQGGFLNTGQNSLPDASNSRIGNHSYIGSYGSNLQMFHRVDWLVESDEFIQVVGFTGGGPLLGSGFNVIAVNATGRPTNAGSKPISGDAAYTLERTRPDLVAPAGSTSDATPQVSSAVAVLIDLAHSSDLSLSNGSTVNRDGDVIYNAERSEVIKAALLAGAARETANTASLDVIDYRVNLVDQTSNGLDRRYGAGQLNIYNSYHVVLGGEQDSEEDNSGTGGLIGHAGFDFDASFGGAGGSNAEASYFFSTGAGAVDLTASLVWNISIDPGSQRGFDQNATLYDLGLYLYDVTDSSAPILAGVSESSFENTENIWTSLESDKDYVLRVKRGTGQGQFEWDYALAWQLNSTADTGDDRDGDGVPDAEDAFPDDPNESIDTDGDGTGDNADAG